MSDGESVDSSEIPFSSDNEPIVIDFSKPIVKRKRPTPPPKQPDPEPAYWSGYLHKGVKLFTYMTEHFEGMFDSENTIKEFYIYPIYHNRYEHEYFYDNHAQEIQHLLVPWIRNELAENKLFDSIFWRPLHNWTSGLSGMYMGYRKLFVFNNNNFQLIITDDCEATALLGLVHHEYIEVSPDNMITERFWTRK